MGVGLKGKRVAILATNGVEQVELEQPRRALNDAGAGRTLTSWPSLRTDIQNAGGKWVDEVVHVDDTLVSSRKPDDLPKFCATVVKVFSAKIEDAAVDSLSEQNFPASDPPPGPSANGGQGVAKSSY